MMPSAVATTVSVLAVATALVAAVVTVIISEGDPIAGRRGEKWGQHEQDVDRRKIRLRNNCWSVE